MAFAQILKKGFWFKVTAGRNASPPGLGSVKSLVNFNVSETVFSGLMLKAL